MEWYVFIAVKGARRKRVEVRARDWQDACDFMEHWIDEHGFDSYYEDDEG